MAIVPACVVNSGHQGDMVDGTTAIGVFGDFEGGYTVKREAETDDGQSAETED